MGVKTQAALNHNIVLVHDTLQELVAEDPRLHQIEKFYSLRNRTDVRRFLRTHPQLIEVLLDARAHVQEHFGSGIPVVLEVVSDPEVEGWDQLFAYILTSLPVREALAQLNKLDKEWFLDQLDRVDGLFNFNLEFV